jgi:TolB-like protein/Tfp pilus assembly protein PilF
LETFDFIVNWLAEHEAALSALAALIGLIGVSYGIIHFAYSHVIRKNRDEKTPATESAPALTATPTRTSLHDDHVSLAVLRFETLSRNEDDEFMASGIASEIIALVTPVKDIRVSSRLTTFGWGSDAAAIKTAGEQINADFALSGSLQHAGDRIKVIASLTDIESDSEVWTHTYTREFEDLFEVQHEIAKSIVGAILGEVKLAESLLADKVPGHELDAWGLVQKAYHFWLTTFTVEGILQACDYLRTALSIDPDYATARAALAMLLAQQMTSRVCEDYDEVSREAADMIEEAYRLAPNDIDVLENAGVVWQNLGESERATRALRHAVELAPLNLISRGYLGLLLGFTGGEEGARESLQLLRENVTIAPKHPSTPYWQYFQAVAQQALGNYAESVELCRKSLLGQPGWVHSYYMMANAQCMIGEVDSARDNLATAAAINPYLNAELHLQNLDRITGDALRSAPFAAGLIREGLVQIDEERSMTG